MRLLLFRFVLVLAALSSLAYSQQRKRILAIGEVKGYQHDSTSHALAVIERLGRETNLWDTYIRTDSQLLTKKKLESNAKNLDYFDAVFFFTTGELPLTDDQKTDLLAFVKQDGKGFIGMHSAADTFYTWPEYGEMIGGYFDGHPWNVFDAPVIVEDREHPATRHFSSTFTVRDEIYQFRNYSRERVRVLMRLDEQKIDLQNKYVKRTDGDFGVTWVRNYGAGRVFYSTLGHAHEVWDRPDIQKMFIEAAKWVFKITAGEATPRPRSTD